MRGSIMPHTGSLELRAVHWEEGGCTPLVHW
jgi:hypothetical protein